MKTEITPGEIMRLGDVQIGSTVQITAQVEQAEGDEFGPEGQIYLWIEDGLDLQTPDGEKFGRIAFAPHFTETCSGADYCEKVRVRYLAPRAPDFDWLITELKRLRDLFAELRTTDVSKEIAEREELHTHLVGVEQLLLQLRRTCTEGER